MMATGTAFHSMPISSLEDHSAMLQLDYDGYGEGSEWQEKKQRRYLIYDFKDWLLGFEYRYKPDIG